MKIVYKRYIELEWEQASESIFSDLSDLSEHMSEMLGA